MMSDKKKSLYFLMFLILISSAYAFELTTNEQSLSLCPRSTQLFIDLVKNDGQSEQAFDVKIAGSAASWATSIPTGFVLAPNEERAIYTYLTPISNTFPANYDLDVKVSTSSEQKTARHSVIVKDCHLLKTSADLEKEACPKEKLTYDISITNLGEFQEIYSLKAEGQIANNVVLSESNIKLNPGEIKQVKAYVDSPEEPGEYEFTIVADSQYSNAISSTKAKLIVKPCYNFEISSETEFIEFCDHTKQIIPITIKNLGTVDNVYDLTSDGPLWASIDNQHVEVNPSSSKTVNLILTPDYGVSGNFEINVNTLPNKGDKKAKTTIKSNIKKCNSVFIDVQAEKDEICSSMANKYNVLVKNDGQVAHSFRIEINAPEWVKIDSDKSFSLNPGDEKLLSLVVSPDFKVESGDNTITVKALASDEPAINAEDSMTIQTISKQDCYKATVKAEKKSIEMYADGSATVPINIENNGKYKSTYVLSLTDTASSFTQLNPSIVDVDSGKSEVVYAYIAPGLNIQEGTYKAIVSASLKDSTILSSDSFDIKITGVKNIAVKESLWSKIKNKIVVVKNYIGGFFIKNVANETIIPIIAENNTTNEAIIEPIVEKNQSVNIASIGNDIVSGIDKIETANTTNVPEQHIAEITTSSIANLESIDLVPTINKMMLESDSFNILINNESHTIKLEAVSNDSVFLSIQSNLNYVLLKTGETKSVDLNNDGTSDLEITFNGFKNGKADLTFNKFGIKKQGIFSKLINKINSLSFMSAIKDYQNYIIIAVILILLIVIILKTKFHKKVANFFEEEVEEDEGKNE